MTSPLNSLLKRMRETNQGNDQLGQVSIVVKRDLNKLLRIIEVYKKQIEISLETPGEAHKRRALWVAQDKADQIAGEEND